MKSLFLLLIVCCMLIGCRGPVENAMQKAPYTKGAGSSCRVALDNEGTTDLLFYLDAGQTLKMNASDVKGVIRLQLTAEDNSVIFENDNVYADMEDSGTFGILAEQEGNYTLVIDIVETGGSFSAEIE